MAKAKTEQKKKNTNCGHTPYEKELFDLLNGKWKITEGMDADAKWWGEPTMRNRTVKATVRLTEEASNRSGYDREKTERCFGATACSQSGADYGLNRLGFYTVVALWFRSLIENKNNPDLIDELLDIESDERLEMLSPVTGGINFIDLGHEEGCPENIEALTKVIANRLTKNHFRYKPDDSKRHGPTWDLYQRLLTLIDNEDKERARKLFEEQFWSYALAGMRIADGFDHKSEESNLVIVNPDAKAVLDSKKNDEMKKTCLACLDRTLIINTLNMGLEKNSTITISLDICGVSLTDRDFNICGSDGNADPFTFDAGLTLLEDENSDLVFANGISKGLLGIYSYLNPWSEGFMAEKKETHEPPSYIKESKNGYIRNIIYDTSKYREYVNMAQIIYRETTYIITPPMMRRIMKQRERGDTDREIYTLGIGVALEEVCNTYALYKNSTEKANRQRMDKEKTKAIKKIENASDSEAEQLQRELDETKKQMNDMAHELETVQAELRTTKHENKLEQAELYDLREIVYKSLDDEPEETESEETENDKFPYETSGKLVVYGGHEKWRTGLREKLPNITIAPKSEAANYQLVRNADVLWIQTNAISHSLYHSVYDCAKNANVPIRLFTSAGVITCAEQVIQSEQQNV